MYALSSTSAPTTGFPFANAGFIQAEVADDAQDWHVPASEPELARAAGADRNRSLAILLTAVARGDRAALGQLYEATSRTLLGVAWRILHRQDLAEEALHDAFIRIWTYANRYEPHLSAPMTWMASIVRNRALDMIRRRSREEPLDEEAGALEDLEATDATPEDAAIHGEHAGLMREHLARLDPNQRRAIMLTYYEGLSHPELAERMGAPLGTVKTWVRRGLLALQKQMAAV